MFGAEGHLVLKFLFSGVKGTEVRCLLFWHRHHIGAISAHATVFTELVSLSVALRTPLRREELVFFTNVHHL